ncbi:hypothetical protein FRB90_006388 [Tulasnella sp. 427]|nr:hypothetical protein FRB90_006388 [Tulasnella sp. 427]
MDVRQLMQEACAGDEPDETAVIGLYRSAAAEDLLDDFVAATKELLSQRVVLKNPLQSVAMDVLAEVLLRASEGDSDANELFSLLVTHGKSKEVIIALDEVFDTFSSQNTLDETELDEDTNAGTLTLLVRGYSLVLPRLVLRKAKAEDSIESILKRIRTAANITLPKADQAELEAFLGSTVDLLSACIDWCAKDPSSSPSTTKDICRRHLNSTLELCIPQLNTRVSFLAFQELYPRQAAAAVRRIDLSSVERGGEIFEKAVTLSDTLGDSPQSRLNSVKSSDEANALACFVLLAHDMRETPSLEQLGETAKMVMACLTSGLASDEALAWTLRCLHAGSELLPEGPACSLSSTAQALAQVASLSPDSIVRQVAFQALTDLLSRTSPILRNELLAELLSECPFPQMRTAAISLLKRFLIDALASEESVSKVGMRSKGPLLDRPLL